MFRGCEHISAIPEYISAVSEHKFPLAKITYFLNIEKNNPYYLSENNNPRKLLFYIYKQIEHY